ncbi:hypothetical protein BDZ85DRAFT_266776 [Elsinoe ampelina]|uniref:Uncharacterized protein n=1 Tax=Elsinoe ampelina TaxID=302913 RepID=A0A6A6G4S8_9PEZI|nr:hypothetical protein BDZ85DRAFT_266776 [Elsinoe ampelina]
MPYIELDRNEMPKNPFIVEDSSTIAYEDYVEQKNKRSRSPDATESVTSGASFKYQVAEPAQPSYTCYANGQPYPPIQPAAYQCYPQNPTYMPHYAYQPQASAYYPTMPPPGYQQYACYPNVMAGTTPAAVTVATSTKPAASSKPAASIKAKDDDAGEHFWIGRTRAQVDEDNLKIAAREGVFKYDPMKPSGAAPDALFWVSELDGRTTLRMFKTIDEELGPGKWERDARYGNAYFVREEPEEEKKT